MTAAWGNSWGNSWLISWLGVVETSKGWGGSRHEYEAYRKELERIIKISEKRFEKPENVPKILKKKIPTKIKKAIKVYNKIQPKTKRVDIDYGVEITLLYEIIAFYDNLIKDIIERQKAEEEETIMLLLLA